MSIQTMLSKEQTAIVKQFLTLCETHGVTKTAVVNRADPTSVSTVDVGIETDSLVYHIHIGQCFGDELTIHRISQHTSTKICTAYFELTSKPSMFFKREHSLPQVLYVMETLLPLLLTLRGVSAPKYRFAQ